MCVSYYTTLSGEVTLGITILYLHGYFDMSVCSGAHFSQWCQQYGKSYNCRQLATKRSSCQFINHNVPMQVLNWHNCSDHCALSSHSHPHTPGQTTADKRWVHSSIKCSEAIGEWGGRGAVIVLVSIAWLIVSIGLDVTVLAKTSYFKIFN